MTANTPQITVVVPSLNQGQYLNETLSSIFQQEVSVEVFVMDGGSTDTTLEVISKWDNQLTGWRSRQDSGQAAAINEGVALGTAPYVCWLNSDDFFYPGGLTQLLSSMEMQREKSMVYGKCWAVNQQGKKISPYITTRFSPRLFANFCFIAQPATLITRNAWEQAGGLNEAMEMAFDYDLWWRLYTANGNPTYCRQFIAATRMHAETKTANQLELHYKESSELVSRHWGKTPLKWRTALPLMKLVRKLTL